MSRSLDVVLNAIDNTSAGYSSAASNVHKYAAVVIQENASVLASLTDFVDVGVSKLIMGLLSPTGLLTAGVSALALAGYACYKNWDVVGPVFKGVGQVAYQMLSDVGSSASGIAGKVASTVKSMVDGTFDWTTFFKNTGLTITKVLAACEFGYKNFGDVASLVYKKLRLETEKYAQDLIHLSTTVIPNWVKSMKDPNYSKAAYVFTNQVYSDWFENSSFLPESWKAMAKFGRKQAGYTPDEATYLGAQELLSKIAPKRLIVEQEKQWEAEIKALEEKLGPKWDELSKKRQQQFEEFFDKTDFKGIAKSLWSRLPDFGGFNLPQVFSRVTEPTSSQTPTTQLGSGEDQRFLTGVTASAQERMYQMQQAFINEQKETKLALNTISQILGVNFPAVTTAIKSIPAMRGILLPN